MPLLQGQPFRLITSLENINQESEIFIIGHTGERFQNKKDYEDRLALYSQNIWTCQCTGKGCLTHKEAWLSESVIKVSAKAAVSRPLQKPLLMLVHNSLSPLDQLVDAASILCYSQFHIGEELTYHPGGSLVRVIKVKDIQSVFLQANGPSENIHLNHGNGVLEHTKNSVINGTANGILNTCESTIDSRKDVQVNQGVREECINKKDMLPRLYTCLCLENKSVIEDILPSKLTRVYKVPSKDQLRLFIRSCALRHRGSTCTPWMVAEDLLKEHGIANKLPSLLSPKTVTPPQKRKKSPQHEVMKKFKPDKSNSQKMSLANKGSTKNNTAKIISRMFGQKSSNTTKPSNSKPPVQGLNHNSINVNNSVTGLMSIPKISSLHSIKVPKKRGRPRLSMEEKERNKKLRQETLFNATGSLTGTPKFLKIKTKSTVNVTIETTITPIIQHPSGLCAPYKSPLKRATTSEALMKLPLMRRLVHEYKTIKGVMGQYRRMAYTMDLVLGKLTPVQIELIPDEPLKSDLYLRQQKVENKKLLNNMTPDERKEYMKKKAREVALERWKERKLKNLKIEDNTLKDLKDIPLPQLVSTPEGVDNCMFGDVVMITEFVKCYRELLLGEEKFKITSANLMEALGSNQTGYKVIVDLICCLLPAIIHDDTSKHCTHLGVSISAIPINYQTAPELARLCLKRQEFDNVISRDSDEYEQIRAEQTELSDEILGKLETDELWNLTPAEVIAILKALVHKALGCSSLNAFMEETDEKLSIAFREKRLVLKKLAKERLEEHQKKRADKKPKGDQPKRQRGRPKGYSPKIGGNIQEFYEKLRLEEEEAKRPMVDTVLQRRKSAEALKKEKEALELLEKERQKQLEDDGKKRAVERKYEDLLIKRDNLLRRQPIGYDRDHNRYWIFHNLTPGLYVEKGWIDPNTNCQFIQKDRLCGHWTTALPDHKDDLDHNGSSPNSEHTCSPQKIDILDIMTDTKVFKVEKNNLFSHNGCLSEVELLDESALKSESAESDDDRPLSIVTTERSEEDIKPISTELCKLQMHDDEDNKPLSSVKSKLTLSPMKMANRGRPPKEAYVLVDEDTQTFPNVEDNSWHCYGSMDDIKTLRDVLSDKGQRESQLLASININLDRLQYHYNIKPESLKSTQDDTPNRVKESLKEDIVQIERELIEGWLGGILNFNEWESKVKECVAVHSLCELLIEVQKSMHLKFLKGLMAPVKKLLTTVDSTELAPEYEDVEGMGVTQWKEAVRSCTTYSRMHVLVGMFDSSIKWERSMATRKCKVCRSKQKDDPLLMCEKCENSYHTYCLRPPLKGEIPDSWLCPMCAPKKVRRDKEEVDIEEQEDPDEKEDPTFSVTRPERNCKKKPSRPQPKVDIVEKKLEQECCICWGRIGLIFCSKCSTPYHSECHEPPLQSRARKDWVCAACLNSKSSRTKKVDRLEAPTMRRNVFGDMEEIVPKEKKTTNTEKNSSGKFVVKKLTEMEDDSLLKEHSFQSEDEEKAEEKTRGAKTKALTTGKDFGSRRSGRNMNRKNYKYDSEEESCSDSDDDEVEDGVEDDVEDGVEDEVDSISFNTRPPMRLDEVVESDAESVNSESGEDESPRKNNIDEMAESDIYYENTESNVNYDEEEYDENPSFDEVSEEESNQDGSSDDQLELSQEMNEEQG